MSDQRGPTPAESRLRGPLVCAQGCGEVRHQVLDVVDAGLLFGDEGVGVGEFGSEVVEGLQRVG